MPKRAKRVVQLILLLVICVTLLVVCIQIFRVVWKRPGDLKRNNEETAETVKAGGLTVYEVCPGDGFGEIHFLK